MKKARREAENMDMELLGISGNRIPAEANRIREALERIPEEELPPLLGAIKGLSCKALGLTQDANRVFLRLFDDLIDGTEYWEMVNDFRVEHHKDLSDHRPKILTNGFGGRIGLSTMPHADTVSFLPGEALEGRKPTLITYRLNQDSFLDVLKLLPDGWRPDLVLFIFPEVFSLPRDLEASPYPVIGVSGDPWKVTKISQDIQFFDAIMPGMKHWCAAYEKLGNAIALYTSCAGTQGYIPWFGKELRRLHSEKKYDVVFTGVASGPFYRNRSRYLWRLLRLSDRYRIFVGFVDGEQNFHELICQAKIVVHCPSIQGGVNLRPFEAIGYGALLMHEEGDRSIEEFFEAGKEVILFNESNFEELLEYYLQHDEERERIATQAMERNSLECSITTHMGKVIELIGQSPINTSIRGASKFSEAQKWNALGISDFYALNCSRAEACFRKAIKAGNGNKKYINNLAVCLMRDAIVQGKPNPEIESLLFSASRGEDPTAASRFNLVSFYRFVQFDRKKFMDAIGRLIHDLRSDSGVFPEFAGDELFFHMEGADDRLFEDSIFRIELEFLLASLPAKGAEYQERLLRTLLWRTLEYAGDVYSGLGLTGSALAAYQLALRTFPQNENILRKLSRLYVELCRLEEASDCLKRVLHLSPFQEEAHLDLCAVQLTLGRKPELRARVNHLLHYHGLEHEERLRSFLVRAND